jgi:formyltetrahydrofolate hydrolase
MSNKHKRGTQRLISKDVHFADEKMDHGPIILQEAFKLTEKETIESLEARVHKVEHKLYPKAIALFADGRLKIRGRKVKILDRSSARPAGGETDSAEDAVSREDTPAPAE